MKIRSLTVIAVLLSSMSVSLHAKDDYDGPRVFRVDDDKTKVGANLDNGFGLELFGVSAGMYGKSKQGNNCYACADMQTDVDNATSANSKSALTQAMKKCGCRVQATSASKKAASKNAVSKKQQ